jgi:hypothetical protein
MHLNKGRRHGRKGQEKRICLCGLESVMYKAMDEKCISQSLPTLQSLHHDQSLILGGLLGIMRAVKYAQIHRT